MTWIHAHAAEYGADPSHIALIGRSAGSQLAILASVGTAAPGVRAVVGYYGPVDLTDGYLHPPVPDTLGIRKIDEDFLGGTPEQVPNAYRDASPITVADDPHPPTLLIDGGRDHIVEPHFGQELYEHLHRSGTAALLVIPWADHSFDAVPHGPSGQMAIYYTERFLAWAMTDTARAHVVR
jgi:acetyl esterase/lipase